MSEFYVIASVLVLLSLAFVCVPVLFRSKEHKKGVTNARLVNERILELEREQNEALISDKDKQAAITELKLSLLDEQSDSDDEHQSQKKRWFFILAAPALLVGSLVYWQANHLTGLIEYENALARAETLREQMATRDTSDLTPNDYATLALSIREALRTRPNDVRGWSSLGVINVSLGRIEQAIQAYDKALKLSPNDMRLRFKLAEAQMLSEDESDLLDAKRQLQYLIANGTDNRNNYLLLTTVAIKLGDAQLAQNSFSVIQSQLDPSSEFYASIVDQLTELGVDTYQLNVQNDQLIEADENQNKRILVTVELAPALLDDMPESGFLIVFAQSSDGNSRAPLAVKRTILSEFPIQFELTDQDAMIEGMNLTSVNIVNVTARISEDENVLPSAGDLQGSQNNVSITGDQPKSVIVSINKVLE